MAFPTNPIYKLYNFTFDGVVTEIIIKESNNIRLNIPKDEANTDYQEYLEWVSKGNTPEEAD